jgi:L-2-hydroxyglutarate oxidase LhgO
VGRDGRLLEDFCFLEAPGMLHVLNAPSPAATASLAIGLEVADRILGPRSSASHGRADATTRRMMVV